MELLLPPALAIPDGLLGLRDLWDVFDQDGAGVDEDEDDHGC